jgi:predicted deacylase
MLASSAKWVSWAFIVLVIIGGLTVIIYYTGTSEPLPEVEEVGPVHEVIGTSVEGRSIDAYTFGSGDTHLAFVGGIHGGYEWNSVLLAYSVLDYLEDNPEVIPENVSVTIIPSANPDGVYRVIGKEGRFSLADVPSGVDTTVGRFNARSVDLNRNFDCKWQPESMWRSMTVSAGGAPFSEPEARAIRDFVRSYNPAAVVFWHSQSNAVYASECEEGILPQTLALMNTYARAGGYPSVESFEHYEITGDAEGWLASQGIPAITVELSTHETIEWEKNLAGMKAVFTLYAQ